MNNNRACEKIKDQNVCRNNNIQEAAYPTSCSLCLHLFGYYYFKIQIRVRWFCEIPLWLSCLQYGFSLRGKSRRLVIVEREEFC